MAIDPRKSVGTMIKLKRESEGLSQESLADSINVSRDHLSKVERGITLPSIHLIEKLGPLFDLTGVKLYEQIITRLKNQGVYEKWVTSKLRKGRD